MLRCSGCLTPADNALCPRCEGLPSLQAHSPFQALFYLPKGVITILRDGPLLRLSSIPLLLTGVTLSAFLWFGFQYLYQYLHQMDFGADWSNTLFSLFAMGISSLGAIVLFLFLFVPVSTLISMPFLDAISMRAETQFLGAQHKEGFQWLRLIPELLLLWSVKLTFLILALPLLWLPVLGHLLFLYALALFTALDFLDIILMRKQYHFKEKMAFLKSNLLRFAFFAMPLTLMLWLPLLQLLFIPAATVGAVLFVLHSPRAQRSLNA